MSTHIIQVYAPGKKQPMGKYAGQGRINDLWIHAMQYRQPKEEVQALCENLAEQNPGYRFVPVDITGTGHDLYFKEEEKRA